MKKILILLAVSVLGIVVGLIFNGPRSQKTENNAPTSANVAHADEPISATLTLRPTMGTNVAKPGQFADRRTN